MSVHIPFNLDHLILSKLLDSSEIDERQFNQVKSTADDLSCDELTAISRLGFVGDDFLYENIADQLGWSLVSRVESCPSAERILTASKDYGLNIDWCIENHFFITKEDSATVVFTDKPSSQNAWNVIHLACSEDTQIKPILLTPAMAATIEDSIAQERAVSELFGSSTTDIAALAEEAPVINLVNSIVERAIYSEASDIHIEAGEKKMTVRFRVDGKLTEFMQQPASRFSAIASRIKLLSELDIAERRLPQDGRFSTRAGKREFDVRVSTAPDVHGESIVMRLLPKKRDKLSLEYLGFENDHLSLIRKWGKLSNGIILVTGPTGSGKSTTLYGLLSDIKTGEEKILTVEDPVEYQLDGITQVQARSDIGYTFARALRTFLRQDPDIIMVGEIRDKETADISIQSSLTGHLVLSTLHTNDASSVFPRLSDIGVEPYLTAATIQGVQAQRLVRKLCQDCSVNSAAPDFLASDPRLKEVLSQVKEPAWKKPVGCPSCHGKGYKGRVGIYELIAVTPEIRELISKESDVTSIRDLARAQGFRSLFEDGILKAAKGMTTIEEVLRVCSTSGDDE